MIDKKNWEIEFDNLSQTKMTTKDFIRKLLIQTRNEAIEEAIGAVQIMKNHNEMKEMAGTLYTEEFEITIAKIVQALEKLKK